MKDIHLEDKYIPHEKQIEAHTAIERYVLYGGAMEDRKPGEQRWAYCLHKYWAWLKSQEKK